MTLRWGLATAAIANLLVVVSACQSGSGTIEERELVDATDDREVLEVEDTIELVDEVDELISPEACSLAGWQPTNGIVQTSDTTWFVALPLSVEHGCAEVATFLDFRVDESRGQWRARRAYTVCNRCDEPVALYWMGGWPEELGVPAEPVDDEFPSVGKGGLDLTASLRDPDGVGIPADCLVWGWNCTSTARHVLKRQILAPGEAMEIPANDLDASTWHDEVSGSPLPDGTTAPYWENPIDYFAPLALEVQIPRLWFLSTPIDDVVPEQQGDVACVTAGFLLNPDCPTSLDDRPWSVDALHVVRLENAALPPGLLEFLRTPRDTPSP